MKKKLKELGAGIYYLVIGLLLVLAITLGWLGITRIAYPWVLLIQREAVESSKSYNDSTNIQLANYMREYTVLDTKIAEAKGDEGLIEPYHAQQAAIITSMCRMKATAKDINPEIVTFLEEKGGCQ